MRLLGGGGRGGLFAYGAPYVQPDTGNAVVGVASNPLADGLWQVGPTGAVFAQDAPYSGGRNNLGIESSVAAIAGA